MFLGYIDPGSGFTIFSAGSLFLAMLLGLFGIFLAFFKVIFNFIKKYKKIFILLVVAVAVLGIIAGVIMNISTKEFDKKIIILGFDGLSLDIIEPMMKEGELPNFSRLKEKGSYSRLLTTNPSQSPVAWTGFATGRNPGKHGIYDFITRDPKNYMLSLSLSKMNKGRPERAVKGKCFWQYASSKKIPTTVITCPVTFPPDKVYGRMLSGIGVPDILGTEGTFSFYTSVPLDSGKDIGGKVFQVRKSQTIVMNLLGPKVSSFAGRPENVKVPFKAVLSPDNDGVEIEFQKNKFELKKGQWSNWKEVTFKLGMFKKIKGVFKFYLVETEPDFKLYVSPINFDPRHPFFQISYPKNYGSELADKIGLFHTQGMPIDTWAVNEKRLTEKPLLDMAREVLREKKAMLDFELARFEKGILFCYFGSSDIIQHMFWRYLDEGHPLYEADAPQEYRYIIKEWYKIMDNILGEVMEKTGKDDFVMVLSDHGFNTFRRAVHVNSWLRKNGYLELKDPGAESGGELLTDIDWSKTRAYSIGFGAIYINQKGRERDGIVAPGQEAQGLKAEITGKLKQFTDEKYKSPIVNNVYSKEDIFWGDYADDAPDLFIGFNIGYRSSWQSALGAVPAQLLEDNLKKWSGDHLFDPVLVPGVFFSNKKIKKETPSIYDITPTVLRIIGYSDDELKNCDLDGAPLF